MSNVSTTSTSQFRFHSAGDFSSFPDLTWLIAGILPSNGLASVFGPSGVGKSFLSLDMAASIALGADWFGRATTQGKVYYFPLEGKAGLKQRIAAWEEHFGLQFPKDIAFIDTDHQFNIASDASQLAAEIKQQGDCSMIIIDTLNKSSPGADENSSSDMGKIIAGASILQQATNSLVLLIHHPGKDGTRGLRGHSSLFAALDLVIEVSKDGQVIRWEVVKSKDGRDGLSHSFKLAPVTASLLGKAVESCVVEPVDGEIQVSRFKEPKGQNQRKVLSAIRTYLSEELISASVSESPSKPFLTHEVTQTIARNSLSEIDDKHRHQRATEAIEALIRQGYLSVNPDNCLELA